MFQLPLIAHSASSNHWSENVKHLSTPSIFAGSEEFNPMLCPKMMPKKATILKVL